MKKKLLPFFIACLAATFVALLAFANNVVAIVRWWRAFLAAGGDSSGVLAHAPGFVPWLDWTAVDYSAVTTFIPFLGFACMAVAAFRILCGRRMRVGDFPFFRGSDQLNVALGLFGTLWGIIVIGYFKLDTVQMADLMQCLHTALFSTLMAVVWVFMIDRPLVRPFFTRLLEASGLAETDDGDLAAAVDRLVVRLGAASDAFDKRQQEYETAFEKRLANYEQEFDKRQKEYVEFFSRRIDELEKRARESEDRLAKVTDDARWRGIADRAFSYIETGPLKTYDWAAQFEDTNQTRDYVGQCSVPAFQTALLLLERFPGDAARVAQARELADWVEDQFVFWRHPCRSDGRGILSEPSEVFSPHWGDGSNPKHDFSNWIEVPSVTEKYHYNQPESGLAGSMARLYLKLYRVTREHL